MGFARYVTDSRLRTREVALCRAGGEAALLLTSFVIIAEDAMQDVAGAERGITAIPDEAAGRNSRTLSMPRRMPSST
jgi:hypothetical protein